jgi:hypothetical protein
MSQRYTVVSDDDGHEYVIPVEQRDEFYAWLADEERSTYEENDRYDEYRLNGGTLTFTDPQTSS